MDNVNLYGTMSPTSTVAVDTDNAAPSDKQSHKILIDEAIERIGNGPFQYKILLAAGLCFMADAMEVLLLSFLSTVLKHEWDLGESQVDSIVAVVFAGALLGTVILGTAGDLYGRKPVFLVTAALIALAGVGTALCRTYEHLLMARFWVGFGVGGLTVPFDTLGEFLPTSARGKNLLYIEFFWTVGSMSVPTLAYLTLNTTTTIEADNNSNGSHWQLFVILCSVPCFLSAILGLVLVPESPRWLLEQRSRESRQRALDILRSAAKTNGISQSKIDRELFPPNALLVLSTDDEYHDGDENDNDNDNDVIGEFELQPTINGNKTSTSGADNDHIGEFGLQPTINGNKTSTSGADNDQNHPTIWSRLEGTLVSFKELFRTPDRTRTISFLLATWFGFGFLYYGVIIAVSMILTNQGGGGGGGDNDGDYGDDAVAANNNNDDQTVSSSPYDFDYAGIFITSSAEIFGLIVVIGTIDSMGRVLTQSIAYRIGGASTFLLGILCVLWIGNGDDHNNPSSSHRWILIGLAFIARMAMMGASCTTWVAATEILATEIRSTGHGTANAMARLGGFFAPYVITEGNSMLVIGTLVLLVSLVTAECASQLPETTGRNLGEVGAVPAAAAAAKDGGATPKKKSDAASSYHELL